jgi:hypothetical protein
MSDQRTDLSTQEPAVSTSDNAERHERYEDLEPSQDELFDIAGGCATGVHMPSSLST